MCKTGRANYWVGYYKYLKLGKRCLRADGNPKPEMSSSYIPAPVFTTFTFTLIVPTRPDEGVSTSEWNI